MINNTILDEAQLPAATAFVPRWWNWLPLFILWGLLLVRLVVTYTPDFRTLAAAGLLIAVTAMSRHRFPLGVKLLLGLLFVGSFNLVSFSPLPYSLSIGLGVITIPLVPELILLFFVHYFLNERILSRFLWDSSPNIAPLPVDPARVAGFKARFAKENRHKLELIAGDTGRVAAARQAAQELLTERADA